MICNNHFKRFLILIFYILLIRDYNILSECDANLLFYESFITEAQQNYNDLLLNYKEIKNFTINKNNQFGLDLEIENFRDVYLEQIIKNEMFAPTDTFIITNISIIEFNLFMYENSFFYKFFFINNINQNFIFNFIIEMTTPLQKTIQLLHLTNDWYLNDLNVYGNKWDDSISIQNLNTDGDSKLALQEKLLEEHRINNWFWLKWQYWAFLFSVWYLRWITYHLQPLFLNGFTYFDNTPSLYALGQQRVGMQNYSPLIYIGIGSSFMLYYWLQKYLTKSIRSPMQRTYFNIRLQWYKSISNQYADSGVQGFIWTMRNIFKKWKK